MTTHAYALALIAQREAALLLASEQAPSDIEARWEASLGDDDRAALAAHDARVAEQCALLYQLYAGGAPA